MGDVAGDAEGVADGTVDIGAAIQRGVELLAQQSVETPAFRLRTVFDLYTEGVRAVKSRAPAARVLQAWSDAAAKMAIERALERLGDPTVPEAVLAAYTAATATLRVHVLFCSYHKLVCTI